VGNVEAWPPDTTKIEKPIPTLPPLEREELLISSPFKGEIEREMGQQGLR
jgi:hypothetical protein